MYRYLILSLLLAFNLQAVAQISLNPNNSSSVLNAVPREYTIGGIMVTGAEQFDSKTIILLSGLEVGDKIKVPGEDIAMAIRALWKQNLFSDVAIFAQRIQGSTIFLEINLTTLPRLSKYSITGAKKNERDRIREDIQLIRGKVVNENLILNTKTIIERYYIDKGRLDVEVNISQTPDTTENNAVVLDINIKRGDRVKIAAIEFDGVTAFKPGKLRRSMSETKKKAIYRIFSSSKFLKKAYKEDLKSVIATYQTKGYRDARIESDSLYRNSNNDLVIRIKVDEGSQYYFGNVNWVGNSKYSSDELSKVLGIKPGDLFDQTVLDSRLYGSMDGNDISSLYLDDGYLFFQINPVEVAERNDTIDLEMRIYEGQQATINQIKIQGNTRTNDHVIRREIRTKPGQLFSRSDIIRTNRELATLGYFDPEQLEVNPVPNPQTGTVDIEYKLVEKSTSQIELQGGWGAGRVVGTFGVIFDNFSARNFFKKGAWQPLPSGDGQRLSIRAQSYGVGFQSYNFSFTEPWLGGKKPRSLTVSFYKSIQSNGLRKSDPARQSIDITGIGANLGSRLKFPDDFFTGILGFNFQKYTLSNYNTAAFAFSDGQAHNVNFTLTLTRNSISAPIYPRGGSSFSVTTQFTPPYSLFNNKDYSALSDGEKFKWIEYHKWKFKSTWFTSLVGDLVLRTSSEFGFLNGYNDEIGAPPFERFYVGGDGLSNFVLDGREVIGLRGYPNQSLTPEGGGTMYGKYTLELRYPLTLNPASTIYGLVFAEGGNAWDNKKAFKPFQVNRSVGMGVRIFLPQFGLLGVDFGRGFDTVPGQQLPAGWQTHFIIGQQF